MLCKLYSDWHECQTSVRFFVQILSPYYSESVFSSEYIISFKSKNILPAIKISDINLTEI